LTARLVGRIPTLCRDYCRDLQFRPFGITKSRQPTGIFFGICRFLDHPKAGIHTLFPSRSNNLIPSRTALSHAPQLPIRTECPDSCPDKNKKRYFSAISGQNAMFRVRTDSDGMPMISSNSLIFGRRPRASFPDQTKFDKSIQMPSRCAVFYLHSFSILARFPLAFG